MDEGRGKAVSWVYMMHGALTSVNGGQKEVGDVTRRPTGWVNGGMGAIFC
jgi:hypothetical protein